MFVLNCQKAFIILSHCPLFSFALTLVSFPVHLDQTCAENAPTWLVGQNQILLAKVASEPFNKSTTDCVL